MPDTLQSIRIKRGLTQGDVAKKLGVTIPTVSSWERYAHKPSPRYIPQLAKVLGRSTDDIFLLVNNTKLSKVE